VAFWLQSAKAIPVLTWILVTRRLTALWGVGLLCLGSGCYTDRINVPPTVTFPPNTPTTASVGQTVTFSADAQDDGSVATEKWGQIPGVCPMDTSGLLPQTMQSSSTYSPSFPDTGPYCVYVIATDNQGATATATQTVTVVDDPPQPSITPMLPNTIPLYSDLHFSGRGWTPNPAMPGRSTIDPNPGDSFTLAWQLVAPPTSHLPNVPPPCSAGYDGDTCFEVDVEGTYTISLTATDNHGMSSPPLPQTFTVAPDQPACITGYDPSALTIFRASPLGLATTDPSGSTIAFSVTAVSDDGDPFPPTGAHMSTGPTFSWSFRNGTTGVWQDLPSYVNGPYYPHSIANNDVGSVLQVRVEVNDRVVRAHEFDACSSTDKCEVTPGCDGSVTWTVTFQ
jgi:hypothetical protein